MGGQLGMAWLMQIAHQGDQHRKQEGGLRGYVVSLCYGARKDDEGERELCPMNVVCFGSAMEDGTLKASDRACPPAVGFS